MIISVPANWDTGLLGELRNFPIKEIYGMSAYSIVGGGRPGTMLPYVTRRDLARYIAEVRACGMDFNYLLSSPCLGNIEYTKRFKKDLVQHVGWLHDIGVNSVTVSIPYLVELIKKYMPGMKIRISAVAGVNTIQRAKFFEGLGANGIVLSTMINRDFRLLRNIRESVNCNLTLILNDICLYQCPLMSYHYNVNGHASQNNGFKGFYIDYCAIRCSLIRHSRPEEMLKSRWIRPEDLQRYEQIGIDSFKISGRNKPSTWILNTVNAYSLRRYPGNLIDLMECIESPVPSPDGKDRSREGSLSRSPFRFIKNNLSIQKLVALSRVVTKLPLGLYSDFVNLYSQASKMHSGLYIDNTKLEGFIDFFYENKCDISCSECDYCRQWIAKAARLDLRMLSEYTNVMERLLDKCI